MSICVTILSLIVASLIFILSCFAWYNFDVQSENKSFAQKLYYAFMESKFATSGIDKSYQKKNRKQAKISSYNLQQKAIQVKQLNDYLYKYKIKQSFSVDEFGFKNDSILLYSDTVIKLYQKRVLNSATFIDTINKINDLSIELNHSSEYFDEIFDTIQTMKNNSTNQLSKLSYLILYSEKDYTLNDDNFNVIEIETSNDDINLNMINSLSYFSKIKISPLIDETNKSSLIEISVPFDVTSINESFFKDLKSMTDIIIPPSITSIGTRTFANCTLLKQISMPSTIKSFGDSAFADCSSLTKIDIPNSVTSIGSSSFSGCSSLTEIAIEYAIQSISSHCFYGCSSLTHISLPISIREIDEFAFSKCTSLIDFSIPENTQKINNFCFAGCTSLVMITIPSFVQVIGNSAFSECTSLSQISIFSSNISIGNSCFVKCHSLK